MNQKLKILSTALLGTMIGIPANADTVYMCEPCPAGYSCKNGVKTICPAGTFAAAGAKTCTPCQAGTYSSAGASYCTICPAGYSCKNGVKTICPAGMYATSGASNCSMCPSYYWSHEGSASCGKVFVAVMLSHYTDSGKTKFGYGFHEWVNIESFIDNRYCKTGIFDKGFHAYAGNFGRKKDGLFVNFGTSPTMGIAREDDNRDFLKGDCNTISCVIRSSMSEKAFAILSLSDMVITQYYIQGGNSNIYNAIKIVYDSSYFNKCFGPK